MPRILGRIRGRQPGPRLVVVAGIHGNEPAGVRALERFFASVSERSIDLRGEVIGVIGNIEALAEQERYLDEDLNRLWTDESVASARREPKTREQRELAELVDVLDPLLEMDPASGQRTVVIDLHTASADGPPFLLIGDTLRNRALARAFPIPLVLGLEESVEGALLDYVAQRGALCVGFEGGQHDDPASIDNLYAVIWIALTEIGGVWENRRVRAARGVLRAAASGHPEVVEIQHRHGIGEGEHFRMRDGFENFSRVTSERAIADHDGREIRVTRPAHLLLPLYQGLGNDGFFLARPVDPVWFPISAFLRRRRMERLLAWLPGVNIHPEQPDTLVIDTRIARWQALEFFHLFGYRKVETGAKSLLLSRRPHDIP